MCCVANWVSGDWGDLGDFTIFNEVTDIYEFINLMLTEIKVNVVMSASNQSDASGTVHSSSH